MAVRNKEALGGLLERRVGRELTRDHSVRPVSDCQTFLKFPSFGFEDSKLFT